MMKYILVAWLLIIPASLAAQTTDIKDLHFISGNWAMQHEWGDMEENWTTAMGNSMTGSFRCVKDGKVLFYEYMMIEQTAGGPVMYLRHFNPGSIGWEEKDKPNVYPLSLLEKNKAVFEQADKKLKMTFVRKDAQHLTITLEMEGKDGKWEKHVFDFSLKA